MVDDELEVTRLGGSDAADFKRAISTLALDRRRAEMLSPPGFQGHLARALDEPNCYVFLAAKAGAPVGYISAYRFPRLDAVSDQLYIFDIAVDPGARRRGVGARLMHSLLSACWAEGVTWAWAGTARENIAAQRLFAAAGGKRVSETYVEYHFAPAPGSRRTRA